MAKSKPTTFSAADTATIKAKVASESRPYTHPAADYEAARKARDAQANGVGRRLSR